MTLVAKSASLFLRAQDAGAILVPFFSYHFRDSAFVDDVAKTNLTAILQQNGLENVRSL